MRLHNTGTNEGADEIFMNFAPGGQNEHNGNNEHQQLAPDSHDYEDPLDDVFGSAPASPLLQADAGTTHDFSDSPQPQFRRTYVQDPSDIPRLRSLHVTNGYREGLSASKEQHVQAGFDEGYSLGAELGMKVGWILGVLEGVVRALPVTSAHAAGLDEADEGDGRSNSEESGRREGGLSRADVRAELKQAEEEMSMQRLFGEEYFGGDGVWTYSVPGAEKEGEESVTFKEVADAHPLVVKWEGRVRELAESLNLSIG